MPPNAPYTWGRASEIGPTRANRRGAASDWSRYLRRGVATSRTGMKKSSGYVGGYLQGHSLMRAETSHTHSGITNSCCYITGPSSV